MFSQDDVDRVQPSIARLKAELDKAYNVFLYFRDGLINKLGSRQEGTFAIKLLEEVDEQMRLLKDSYHNHDINITANFANLVRRTMRELSDALTQLYDIYESDKLNNPFKYLFDYPNLKPEIEQLRKFSSVQINSSDPKSLIELMKYRVEQLNLELKRKDEITEKVIQLHDNVTIQQKDIAELVADGKMHKNSKELTQFSEKVRERIAELTSKDIDIEIIKKSAANLGLDTSEIEKSFTESSTARDQIVSTLQSIARTAETQAKQLIADEAALFRAKGPLLELEDNVSAHLDDLAKENTDIKVLISMQSQFKEMGEVLSRGESTIHSAKMHKQEIHLNLLKKRGMQGQEDALTIKLADHENIYAKLDKTIRLTQVIIKLNLTCRGILDPDLTMKEQLKEKAKCLKFDISNILNDENVKLKPEESANIDGRKVSILDAASAAIANFDSIMHKLNEKDEIRGIEQSPSMQAKHSKENQRLYDILIKGVQDCVTKLNDNKVTYQKGEKLQALGILENYLKEQKTKDIDIAKIIEGLPKLTCYKESTKHRSIFNIFRTESTTKLSLEKTMADIERELKSQQPKHERDSIPMPVHSAGLRRA